MQDEIQHERVMQMHMQGFNNKTTRLHCICTSSFFKHSMSNKYTRAKIMLEILFVNCDLPRMHSAYTNSL